MTYIQLLEKVNHVAAGFLEIGLERDQVFNVFAQTRCALYPTLPAPHF